MPVVELAVDVAAPPERCFEIFADLDAWPRWFPYLSRAEGKLEPGGKLALTFSAGERVIPLEISITAVDNARVQWSGGAYGLRGRHTHSFEPSTTMTAGTRVSWREEISGLAARLLTRNVLQKIEEEVAAAMHKLKALVEGA